MRVFVAGATGALAHALIPKLRARDHTVVGLSRSRDAAAGLAALGAECVIGDLLDRDGISRVVRAAAPDVVVHAAKALPKNGALTYRAMRPTNRLHHEGTRYLLAAAVDAGASRFVAESIVFAYGYGDLGATVITEDHPTATSVPRPKLRPLLDGVLSMERQAVDAAARGVIEAILMRCGIFYGPRTSTDYMARMLRRRMLPLPAGGRGLWPLIYIDDAAEAFALSVSPDAPAGTYNVVDDEPVTLRELVAELAAVTEAPSAWSVPKPLARPFAPYFAEVATTAMRVSNERAKGDLGWAPEHPTYREGLRAWRSETVKAGR